jgi:hypothetical protein
MGALGRFEVVLGTLLRMSIVRIVGNYFVINPNVMEKAHDPALPELRLSN